MLYNMKFNNINEFNDYISNNLTKYDIITYFNKIHELFNNNTDISFMEYFLSLIDKNDEFCVEHNKLIEYGIIKEGISSTKIKDCIANDKFEFKENIDYIIFAGERSPAKKRGGHNAKYYKMKPHVFKICLMQSKNEKKYAKYFAELEKCFYYYKDYQIKYQEVLLSGKDEKYDKFVEESKKRHEESKKEREELININKKQSNDIKELLKFAKDTKDQNDDLNENINDLNENINDLHEKVDEVNEHLDEVKEKLDGATEDRAPKPEDPKFTNSFIVFKIGLIKYYVLKCQQKSIKTSIIKLKRKFTQCDEVLRIGYSPNTINLYQRVKDELKNNLKANNAIITLVKMTEDELIRKINQINDNKKNVNIP